ncbi:hypothetical protein [Nannocystis pusilla]
MLPRKYVHRWGRELTTSCACSREMFQVGVRWPSSDSSSSSFTRS